MRRQPTRGTIALLVGKLNVNLEKVEHLFSSPNNTTCSSKTKRAIVITMAFNGTTNGHSEMQLNLFINNEVNFIAETWGILLITEYTDTSF